MGVLLCLPHHEMLISIPFLHPPTPTATSPTHTPQGANLCLSVLYPTNLTSSVSQCFTSPNGSYTALAAGPPPSSLPVCLHASKCFGPKPFSVPPFHLTVDCKYTCLPHTVLP